MLRYGTETLLKNWLFPELLQYSAHKPTQKTKRNEIMGVVEWSVATFTLANIQSVLKLQEYPVF